MRPPAPPIDLTSETTHVGGSFEHIGNKKIQTCYSVTPDFFHGISVKLVHISEIRPPPVEYINSEDKNTKDC